MDSIKSQLMDMGFNESKVKRAIESCPEAQTLEHVMEWLIAHEDELNAEPNVVEQTQAKTAAINAKTAGQQLGETTKIQDKSAQAQSSTNNDGSQQAGHENETAANMAARKKITVEEAQRLITERQASRAEEERKQSIEDEKQRRLAGQKMTETRQELQDQERIRLAQQIRREKLEKEMLRKQVLEQIARDREVMKRKSESNNNQSGASSTTTTTSNNHATSSNKTAQQSKSCAIECKIALRFPDGSSLVHKFSPQEQLAAVRLFVQMEKSCAKGTNIEFIAPPNRKLNESMMDDTLESLGLCPASRLEVKFSQAAWVDLD